MLSAVYTLLTNGNHVQSTIYENIYFLWVPIYREVFWEKFVIKFMLSALFNRLPPLVTPGIVVLIGRGFMEHIFPMKHRVSLFQVEKQNKKSKFIQLQIFGQQRCGPHHGDFMFRRHSLSLLFRRLLSSRKSFSRSRISHFGHDLPMKQIGATQIRDLSVQWSFLLFTFGDDHFWTLKLSKMVNWLHYAIHVELLKFKIDEIYYFLTNCLRLAAEFVIYEFISYWTASFYYPLRINFIKVHENSIFSHFPRLKLLVQRFPKKIVQFTDGN